MASRPVLFFDIDNCLYPRSLKIHDLMATLIDEYFISHLSLPASEAIRLHQRYYRDYGLAISGLVKHHQVDPLVYNREVDDALPLERLIRRDEGLIKLLQGVDKRKCKLWLFTNAHITHAQRVVRLLGVEEFFEGMTYCDYSQQPLIAKPHVEMFEKAEREAGLTFAEGKGGEGQRHARCFFVDDSALNCKAAKERGWEVAHKLEPEDAEPVEMAGKYQIRRLEELRGLFPHLWRADQNGDQNGDEAGVNGQYVGNGDQASSQLCNGIEHLGHR